MDEDLIREVRILAAERDLSVSALLREQLKAMVEQRKRYREARSLALTRLEKGTRLGGARLPRREELYDRGSLR